MKNITIMFEDKEIGTMASLRITQQNNCIMLKAFDMNINNDFLQNLFSRGVIHPAAQKLPLNIIVKEDNIISQIIEMAWILDFSNKLSDNQITKMDVINLEASHIHTFIYTS